MPEISVIIATYNRAGLLRECLEALFRQTQPAVDYEILVVVDGSTDDTTAMLATLMAPVGLRVYNQPNRGQTAAVNRGVALARGRYSLFLDDDIIASPDLVAAHVRAQHRHAGTVALGQLETIVTPRADGFARQVAADLNKHYSRLNAGLLPSFMDCYSGNFSVPRDAFLEIGGFATDLPLTCDFELGYRLARNGLTFTYVPDALGQQRYTKNARHILADAEMDGRAGVELYRRHPALLHYLELGAFARARFRQILLRRLLLAAGVPLKLLVLIGRLLRGGPLDHEWSRFVRAYSYWRGVRRAVPDDDTWHRLTQGVPILLYHAFGQSDEPAGRWLVPGRRFRRQMRWLRSRGYTVLAVEEYLKYLRDHRLPPSRSVVITLDDGYLDARAVALPILKESGFGATIFLVSGALGGSNHWDAGGGLVGRPLLSRADVRAMLEEGVRFGAHSRTHVALTSIPEVPRYDEIAGSREHLEREFERPIETFAYPYGKYDRATEAFVRQAGFHGACGVQPGLNHARTPIYALCRTEIYGTDSLFRFVLALETGDANLPFPRPARR